MTTSPIYYLGDIAQALSEPEKRLAAWVINQFGTGDHPWADPHNLYGFATDYLLGCLENAERELVREGNPIRAMRSSDLSAGIKNRRSAQLAA